MNDCIIFICYPIKTITKNSLYSNRGKTHEFAIQRLQSFGLECGNQGVQFGWNGVELGDSKLMITSLGAQSLAYGSAHVQKGLVSYQTWHALLGTGHQETLKGPLPCEMACWVSWLFTT